MPCWENEKKRKGKPADIVQTRIIAPHLPSSLLMVDTCTLTPACFSFVHRIKKRPLEYCRIRERRKYSWGFPLVVTFSHQPENSRVVQEEKPDRKGQYYTIKGQLSLRWNNWPRSKEILKHLGLLAVEPRQRKEGFWSPCLLRRMLRHMRSRRHGIWAWWRLLRIAQVWLILHSLLRCHLRRIAWGHWRRDTSSSWDLGMSIILRGLNVWIAIYPIFACCLRLWGV